MVWFQAGFKSPINIPSRSLFLIGNTLRFFLDIDFSLWRCTLLQHSWRPIPLSKCPSLNGIPLRDPYVKKRLSDPAAYRARSAFKLLEINENWDHFLDAPDVGAVVDLGAAPGGWCQVVANLNKLGWRPAL
ncbi:hypothetical protein BJ912DRAFT_1141726 [Pholiota molesta]|nr:hypothetical protein BJ912DRAFT_1141726 [Pholiota molesta]